MTKEELAKKKGLKVNKDILTPAEKLVTTVIDSPKIEPEPEPKVEKKTDKKPEKRPVGKPKKRKSGDKKLSLWIDEDLVPRLYDKLSYGDTAGAFINKALREYLDNH